MTDENQNQELEKKRKNNRIAGIALIVLGIAGLSLRFIYNNNNGEWRTVDVVKIAVSIGVIVYGIFTLYKNRK